jgi:hypothetical protein
MRKSLSLHAKTLCALIAAAGIVAAQPSARAATTDNFTVRTTADFVALCDTQPNGDNYVAAIHFCQGFAAGAYQYYAALAQRDANERFVCPPDPPPSRNQAIAGFLAWAHANPDAMTAPAVDSLFRYLGQTYPCSGAQRSAH